MRTFELTPGTPGFEHLWKVEDPPEALYVRGREEALGIFFELPERGLAVVGTRENQVRSEEQVRMILDELEGFGVVVLSGLARGIDTIAHEAALDASLRTIAILGCGVDVIYPPENSSLQQRILEAGGLVVSEFPPGTDPKPHHFIKRNRLIAGWSRATWVVEAGARSGALNTASWARKHDRLCFATPCYPGDLQLEGNQTLLDRDHAHPLWNAQSLSIEWLELESFLAVKRRTRPKRRSPLKPDTAKLIEVIRRASLERGGTTRRELLQWSASQKWPAARYFQALREACEHGRVRISNGVVTCRIH